MTRSGTVGARGQPRGHSPRVGFSPFELQPLSGTDHKNRKYKRKTSEDLDHFGKCLLRIQQVLFICTGYNAKINELSLVGPAEEFCLHCKESLLGFLLAFQSYNQTCVRSYSLYYVDFNFSIFSNSLSLRAAFYTISSDPA